MAIIYSATRYRNDPRVFDHYDIFNREKAKEDLNRWKKQIENSEEGEALERVSIKVVDKTLKKLHIKGRLLDQAMIRFNCIPFQMGTSHKGKNLLPLSSSL